MDTRIIVAAYGLITAVAFARAAWRMYRIDGTWEAGRWPYVVAVGWAHLVAGAWNLFTMLAYDRPYAEPVVQLNRFMWLLALIPMAHLTAQNFRRWFR